MDAKTVAHAAEISLGTLNVWIQRGIFPGIETDTKGKQRDFSFEAAGQVILTAALVDFGFRTRRAAELATQILAGKGYYCGSDEGFLLLSCAEATINRRLKKT